MPHQGGQRSVGAERAVSHDDVRLTHARQQLAKELALVFMLAAELMLDHGSAGQREQAHQFDLREPEPSFCSEDCGQTAGSPPCPGRQSGPIQDAHPPLLRSQFLLQNMPLQVMRSVAQDQLQRLGLQPLPGLAIGARAQEPLAAAVPLHPAPPCLDLARHLPTRTRRIKRLPHKRPERHPRRQRPIPAVGPLGSSPTASRAPDPRTPRTALPMTQWPSLPSPYALLSDQKATVQTP